MQCRVFSREVKLEAAKAGLDSKVLCEIINMNSGRNTATVDKFPHAVFTGTFDFGFSAGLTYKECACAGRGGGDGGADAGR